eukprot:scaffold30055_cov65-Phaeocystis_antarctica.AAC.6
MQGCYGVGWALYDSCVALRRTLDPAPRSWRLMRSRMAGAATAAATAHKTHVGPTGWGKGRVAGLGFGVRAGLGVG